MCSILLSALLIPSITFGMGYYQRSGDGSYEWIDTVQIAQTCTTEHGSVRFVAKDGTCPENAPVYMRSETETRILGEYLSDVGRAAVINAQNSKFPDSISNSITDLNNASNSASGANAGSSSNSGAVSNSNAQADAGARAIQQQLQTQEQSFNRHRFGR